MLQDKLIKERCKYMKQQSLPDIFQKIATKHLADVSSEKAVLSKSGNSGVLLTSPTTPLQFR